MYKSYRADSRSYDHGIMRGGKPVRRLLLAVVLAASMLSCGSLACALFDEEMPSVTTNDATRVSSNSATLNGNLTSLGTYRNFTVYFWWGTSPGSYPNENETIPYPNETTPQFRTATGPFSFELTRLSPNTTYYFRAVAEGGTGSSGQGSMVMAPAMVTRRNSPLPEMRY
jgi:hypothetical protein